MDHIINNKFPNTHNPCWNLENMAMEAPNSHSHNNNNNIDHVLHNDQDHHPHTIQHHPLDQSIIPMWPPNFLPLHPSSSSSSSMPPPLAPWSLSSSTPTTQDYLVNQDHLMMLGSSSNNNSQILEEGHHHQDHKDDEEDGDDDEDEELGAMKEMMYKIAAMQPVDIDPATIRKPKRRNVRISDDPQSVAARHRRERISEKIRILQRLVPGGTKMDTASMLDEAIRYVKFLKRQIRHLQANPTPIGPLGLGPSSGASPAGPVMLGFGPPHAHNHNLSLFNHQVIKDN